MVKLLDFVIFGGVWFEDFEVKFLLIGWDWLVELEVDSEEVLFLEILMDWCGVIGEDGFVVLFSDVVLE